MQINRDKMSTLSKYIKCLCFVINTSTSVILDMSTFWKMSFGWRKSCSNASQLTHGSPSELFWREAITIMLSSSTSEGACPHCASTWRKWFFVMPPILSKSIVSKDICFSFCKSSVVSRRTSVFHFSNQACLEMRTSVFSYLQNHVIMRRLKVVRSLLLRKCATSATLFLNKSTLSCKIQYFHIHRGRRLELPEFRQSLLRFSLLRLFSVIKLLLE